MKRRIAATVLVIAVAGLSIAAWVMNRPPTDVAERTDESNLRPGSGEESADRSIPVLGTIPAFTLTDQSGSDFGTDQLDGKVWIANFIFTRCTATCPMQTRELATIQNRLRRHPLRRDIRLISITVDPEHDTPEVLKSYASAHSADPHMWRFLTGSEDDVRKLSRDSFFLPVEEAADDATSPIVHSSKFILIDPYRRIRGYYEALSADERRDLTRDLDRVLAERKAVPPEIVAPPWLESRRSAQLATVDAFGVFHDFQFVDRLAESGITFRNKIVDDAGRDYLASHYDHGNGVAVADVDGDGRLDIYFCTQAGTNELFRNAGGGRFEDVTESAGLTRSDRIWVSASFADIDNDADADLFVTSVRGGNVLYLNDGQGRFQDVSEEAGVDYVGHSSGAVFFDFDRDGLLDLFVCNVGRYTTDEVASVTMEPIRHEAPADYEYYVAYKDAFAGHLKPERNERSILYRNLGDHRFEDVTEKLGLVDESWTGDAGAMDLNADGWQDLYVLNMQGNDEYYENQAGERFVRRSREVFPKTPWGAMGLKAFDFDNDADLDILISDMHSDMSVEVGPDQEKLKADMQFPESFLQTDGASIFGNALFANQGDGLFTELSDALGVENYWPWGLSVGDLNADGYDDVFITASMNLPFRYGVNTLLLNDQGRQFRDSEFILGVEPRRNGQTAIPYFECDCDGADREHIDCEDRTGRVAVWSAIGSRGSVIFDLDEDGDLDIVTNDFNSPPMVLVSNLTDRKSVRYLKVRLTGTTSNRDALGAVVTVVTSEASYMKVNDGQSGYLSHSRAPLYFGLNESDEVSEIRCQWPSGSVQLIAGPIDLNTTLEIVEE